MKNYLTYIGGFVVIVLIGAGVLWGVQEYKYRKSPEYQAMKYFDDLKSKYENDTYGGSTPEETLQLFVDALKKGDVELASKYFVVEKQEEKLRTLLDLKNKNIEYQKYITEISGAKMNNQNLGENVAQFDYVSSLEVPTKISGTNLVIPAGNIRSSITLQKILNRWKIK